MTNQPVQPAISTNWQTEPISLRDLGKTASGEFYYNTEHEDWDTDDEVEEAAADDMIKVIEGDW